MTAIPYGSAWIDPLCKDEFGSDAEARFAYLWVEMFPELDLHTQYRFAPPRKWPFDFAHLPTKTAIEIQGGTWVASSGHRTGKGVRSGYVKYNAAQALGWVVFQLTTEASEDGEKLKEIANVIRGRMS